MPSKNVLKFDIADSYYHVYARGHSRREIFLDEQDYRMFLKLFQRYLSPEVQHDRIGVPYPHLFNKLELLCFCLMPNHFHLLLYQRDEKSMETLMRGLLTSYSRYFNKKYQRSGGLFETRYKASLITNPSYFEHITRYIHLNRRDWEMTPYSSIGYYLGKKEAPWMQPQRILSLFSSPAEYRDFVADYEAHKKILDELKYELANDITT